MEKQVPKHLMINGMTISAFNLFCLLSFSSIVPQENPLQKYNWKNRIIIIYSDNSKLSDQQLLTIQSDSAGFVDRDLLVFQLFKNHGLGPQGDVIKAEDHSWLLNKYFSKARGFQFLLIGKDGGIKLKSDKPVGNSKLFALIDGMPMRMQEMKKNQ